MHDPRVVGGLLGAERVTGDHVTDPDLAFAGRAVVDALGPDADPDQGEHRDGDRRQQREQQRHAQPDRAEVHRRGLTFRAGHAIADAADRLDRIAPSRERELAPKVCDVDVDDVRQSVVVTVPDVVDQLAARHDRARAPGQEVEQRELAGRERDRHARSRCHVRRRVDRHVTDRDRRADRLRRPAQQRTHPGRELGEVERLREVVVRARVEPTHRVDDLVPGREHEHRRHVALFAHLPAHIGAVTVGKAEIEDHRVVRHGRDRMACIECRGDEVDRVAFLGQPAHDDRAERPVILHHEHTHRSMIAARS